MDQHTDRQRPQVTERILMKTPLIGEEMQRSDTTDYYNQFCRLYLANLILNTQLKELTIEKQDLLNRLTKIERKNDEVAEGSSLNEEKKKRIRRTASEIHRHYRCSVEQCQKSYGSEGSLNQHIKLKHPELLGQSQHLSHPYSVSEKQQAQQSSHRS